MLYKRGDLGLKSDGLSASYWRDVQKGLSENGYVVLKDIEQAHLIPIANRLGEPFPDPRTRELVRTLVPRVTAEAPPNTFSARYGTGAFPFHTETAFLHEPVRYLMLHCVNPGSARRPTKLTELSDMIPTLHRQHLQDDVWIVYRRSRPFLTRVLEREEQGGLVRFDPECMKPAHPDSKSAAYLHQLEETVEIDWQQGYLAIIDNHRLLHARGDSGGKDDLDRRLLRLLVTDRKGSGRNLE